MDCSQNAFCVQLPPETRAKLCAKCRKRFFKAQSMQMREDYSENCMLVLDGLFTSTTDLGGKVLNHEVDTPSLYLGLPGCLLNLDITFRYGDLEEGLTYSEFSYLTDTWVAHFNHHVIRQMCDEDQAFRHAVLRNMVQLVSDSCQATALFRSNYTYYGLYHLIRILAGHGLYLNQQQLADLLNHDRTSISKAVSRLKKEEPEAWENYLRNKGRVPTKPVPGEAM